MKNLLYTIACAAALLCAGCSSDKEPVEGPGVDTGGGTVRFEVAVSAEVAATASNDTAAERSAATRAGATIELPAASVPGDDIFALQITGSFEDDLGNMQNYDRSWSTLSSFDSPMMKRGDYTAHVTYGSMEAEGAKAACFAGATDFTILARKTISKSITASLQNAAFKVSFGEWFTNYYSNVRITVRTGSNHSFTFTPTNTTVIFAKPATELYLSGTATKSQTGTAVEFPETKIGTTAVRTLHTIQVDASQAGGAKLVIDLDDTFTEIEEKVIELNPEA